jgi:uncharacterized protein
VPFIGNLIQYNGLGNYFDYINMKYNDFSVTEHYITRSKGDFIFMDVNTLDIYILDEAEKNIIKALNSNKCTAEKELNVLAEEYGESLVTGKIDELFLNGILRKRETKDENNTKNPVYDKDALGVINAIDIFISEDCNLACKYCFIRRGLSNGNKALMEQVVGERTVDFLIKRSGDKKDLFICFFGGEPLINFKVLKHIVTYALDEGSKYNKRFHFSLTTNGTLLSDEIVDFIYKNQIKVLISIDGDIHSHNRNRPLPGGGDSYTEIVNNLRKLDRRNISYSARATVSSFTKSKIAENYEHLTSLGFNKIHFENALAPIGQIFITDKNDIIDIKKQYSLISKKISKNMRSGRSYNVETIPLPLDRIITKKSNFYSCTAGKGYVSVNVNGDIYLCHRFVGEKDFFLGNVIEDIYSLKWSETIRNETNVENRKRCRKCWARYICGGGCYGINYDFNKDISLAPWIYCQLMKYSIKKALCVYTSAASQPEVAEQ